MAQLRTQAPCPSWRWMIFVSRAVISFLTYGMFKAMGVFIPYFVDDLQSSVAAVGAATGIYGSLCSVLAPIASAVTPYGPRKLVIVGSVVMAVGTIGAATSTSALHFALWLSLSSAGESFVLVTSMKPLLDYFPESFATTSGIAFAAGTLGMMVIPPFAEWLIQIYGWRSALCLLGAATFNLCVCGALLRPLTSSKSHTSTTYQRVPDEEEIIAPEKEQNAEDTREKSCENCQVFLCTLRDRFDASLLGEEPWFLVRQAAFFFSGAVYAGWNLFLVPHSVAFGYDSQSSSFLSTFGGLGSLLGRLTSGMLTDSKLIKSADLFVLASIVCAAACLTDPLAVSSFVALCVLATAAGLAIGFTYSLTFVIIQDTIAEDRQMAAFGWLYLFMGSGQIFGGVFSGWVYDITSDYEIVFLMFGGFSLVVVPLTLASRLAGLCCRS